MASSENDNLQKVQSTSHQRQDEMPSDSSNQECFYQDDAQCPCYMCTNHGIEAKPAPSDDGSSGVEFPIRSFWRIAKTQNDIESPMEGNSKGFHYRLLLHPRGTAGTDSESTHLSVFVEAVVQDWYPEYWVFPNVRFELTVVNFKDPKQSVTSWAHWSFSSDATSRGWQKMIMHSKLTKAAGFMDDEGTVLIRGKAEPPYMCLWSKGQPYQPQMMWEYIPDRAQRETCSDVCKKDREDRVNGLSISDSDHLSESDENKFNHTNKMNPNTHTHSGSMGPSTDHRSALGQYNEYLGHSGSDKEEFIGDRLLMKCLDSVVPAISPTLDSDFMAMMVHILYHLREFRRSVLMWNHEFDSEVTEETSIILALQKVFAYMYLYPLAVSCRTYKLSSVDNPDISKYYLYELVPKLTSKNKDLNKLNNFTNANLDDRNERLRELRERREGNLGLTNMTNSNKDKDNEYVQNMANNNDKEHDTLNKEDNYTNDENNYRNNSKENKEKRQNNEEYDNPSLNCCSFDGGRFEWELENLGTSLNSKSKRPENTFANNSGYKLVPGSLSHSIADRPDVFSKLLPPPPNIKPVLKAMHMTDLQTLEPQDQLVNIHSEMFTMLLRDLASAKKLLKQRRLKQNSCGNENGNLDGENNSTSNGTGSGKNEDSKTNSENNNGTNSMDVDNNINLGKDRENNKSKSSRDSEKSIPLYLRDQTMLEGMCKYLFSGSPENETLFRSPSVDDISTIYIRCKHSNSLQKALEASPKTMARYPQVLFFYLYPAKNAKKGELFDVPMRLNCTCIKSTANYDSRSDDSRNTNNYDEYGNFECSEDDDDTFQEFDNVAEKEHNSTRCYSLYALIIKEGDLRYDGVGKGVNSFNTLLLRPEEEGPWYRMCEGKVEKLSNKMDFSEWKCHRDFFCAAAVYLSEDYLDMLGLGEVDLSGNLKEWNPNLYYSTLSELGVTEQDILAAIKYKMKKSKDPYSEFFRSTNEEDQEDLANLGTLGNLGKDKENKDKQDDKEELRKMDLEGLDELRLFSELTEEDLDLFDKENVLNNFSNENGNLDGENKSKESNSNNGNDTGTNSNVGTLVTKDNREKREREERIRGIANLLKRTRQYPNSNWVYEYLHMRRVGFSHPKLSSCCETHGYNPLMLLSLDERERMLKYEVAVSRRDVMRRVNRLKTVAPFVNWLFNASKENTYLLNGINPPTDGKLLVNFLQKRERVFEEEFRHLISELFFKEISENLASNSVYSWSGETCSCGCSCRTCVKKPALLLTENGRFPGEELKMMLSEPATILFRNIQILRCHLEYFSKDCRNLTLQLHDNRANKTGDGQKSAHELQPIQHLLEGSQLQMQYPQLLSNLHNSGSGSLATKTSDELSSHKLKYEMDSHTTLQHILNPHRFETGGKMTEITEFKSTSERSALFLIECIWDACIRYTLDCRTIIFLKACSDEGLAKSSSGLASSVKNPLVTPGGQCRDLFVFDGNMGNSGDLLEHEETNHFDSKYDLKVQDELNIMHYYSKKYKLPSVSEMRNYLRRSRVLVYALIRPHELLRSYLGHKYKVNVVEELEQLGYNIVWNEDAFNQKASLSDLSESELKMYGIANLVPNSADGIGHDLCNIYEKLLTKMLVHMQDVDKEVYPNCFDYAYTVADVSKIVEAIRMECDKTLSVGKALVAGMSGVSGLPGTLGGAGNLSSSSSTTGTTNTNMNTNATTSKASLTPGVGASDPTLRAQYDQNQNPQHQFGTMGRTQELSSTSMYSKTNSMNELNEKCGNSCGLMANNKHVCSQDGCVCLGHECRYNFGYVGFILPLWVRNQMADLSLFTNSQLQVYNESLIEDLSELCLKSDDKKKKKVKPRKQSFEKATCIIPPLDVKLKNIEFDQTKAYQSDAMVFLNPAYVARFYYKRESSVEKHKFTQLLSNTNPYKHNFNTSLGYLSLLNLSSQTSAHLTDDKTKMLMDDNIEHSGSELDKQSAEKLGNLGKDREATLVTKENPGTSGNLGKDSLLKEKEKLVSLMKEKSLSSLSPKLEGSENEAFKVKHAIEVGIITTHDLFGLEGFSCETKVVPTKRLFVSHKYNGASTKVLHLYWAIRKLINHQISDEFLSLGSNKTKKKENCICGYDCPNDNECLVKLSWRPCAGDCFMLYALKNDLHSLRLGKKFVYMQPNMDLSYYVNPDKNKGPDITILVCGGPSSFYLNGVNTWFPLPDDSEYPLLIFKWMCVDTVDLLCLGAIVCDAKKQLQQYIFEWLVPIIKELGYLSSLEAAAKEPEASKELNKDEDVDKYQVLEECYIRSVQNVRRWSCAIKKINKRSGDVIITQLKRTVDSPATMRFKESVLFMNSVKELTELEALELLPDPNNFYSDTWSKHEHDKDEPDLVSKLSKKKKRKTTKAAIPSNKKSTFSRRMQPREDEKLTRPTEGGDEFVKYQAKTSSELTGAGVHEPFDKDEEESELVESSEKMGDTPLENTDLSPEHSEEDLDYLDELDEDDYLDQQVLLNKEEEEMEDRELEKLSKERERENKQSLVGKQRFLDSDKGYLFDQKDQRYGLGHDELDQDDVEDYGDEEMDRLLTKLNEFDGKQFDSGFVSGDDSEGLGSQTFEELSKLRHMEMLSKEGLLPVSESVFPSEPADKSLLKAEGFVRDLVSSRKEMDKMVDEDSGTFNEFDQKKLQKDLDYLDEFDEFDKENKLGKRYGLVDREEDRGLRHPGLDTSDRDLDGFLGQKDQGMDLDLVGREEDQGLDLELDYPDNEYRRHKGVYGDELDEDVERNQEKELEKLLQKDLDLDDDDATKCLPKREEDQDLVSKLSKQYPYDQAEKVTGDIASLVRDGEFRTVLDLCPVMGLVNVCEEVYKLFEQEFRRELVQMPNREFQKFGSPEFFPLGDREILERVGSNYKLSPNGVGKHDLQLSKNLKKLVKLVKMMYTRVSGPEPVREMVAKLYENYGLKASFTLSHLLSDYNSAIPLMDDVLGYFLSDLSKYSHFLFSDKNTYVRNLLEQMVNVAFKNTKVREKSDSSALFLMYVVSTPRVYLPSLYHSNVPGLGNMNVKNDHLGDSRKGQLRGRSLKQTNGDLDGFLGQKDQRYGLGHDQYLDRNDTLDKDLGELEDREDKETDGNNFDFGDDSDSRELDLNVNVNLNEDPNLNLKLNLKLDKNNYRNENLDDLDEFDKENELDSGNELLETNLSYERDLEKKYELSRRTVREALLYDMDEADDVLSKPLLHWVDDEVEQFERLLLQQLKTWWSTRQVILDKIKSHIHPTSHRDSIVIPINIHSLVKEQHSGKDNRDKEHRERHKDELDLFDFRILLYFSENYPEISLCFNRDNVTLYFTGKLDKRSFMKSIKESRQFFGSKNTMRSVPNLPIQHTDTSMTNSSLMDMQLANNQTALLLLSIKYSNFSQNVDSQFLKSVCSYRTFRAFNIPPPPSTSATLQDTV